MLTSLTIDKQFCGPPRSGNGGYVCGMIAKHFRQNCQVKLLMPPPLNTEMLLDCQENEAVLRHGESVIATAKTHDRESLALPEQPKIEEAEAAQQQFTGFTNHSLPTCFVCGPQRASGEGLRIFPGKTTAKSGTVASVWQLDEAQAQEDGIISSEYLWSALDCPGYFAVQEKAGFALLGAFSVQIYKPILLSMQQVVAMGWPLTSDGRKHSAGTALLSDSGVMLAQGLATWISVPKAAFVEATN